MEGGSGGGPEGGSHSTRARNQGGAVGQHPALFDGKDLDSVVAKEDVIADRLADQSARDGRD